MVAFKELIKPLSKDRLMVVDAMNLAFRWKHKKASVFAADYVSTVKSLARSYDCGSIVIAADKGQSSYRREIYPEYKANRKELYANQTEQEAEEARLFFAEFDNTLEVLEKEGFPVFRYAGVEADDIAAFLVAFRQDYLFDHIWLISSDRDWDLLVDDHVSRFSYITRKEQTVDTWDNEVPREDYISYKCLVGDKGDNIPGIPGIGPKRACQLIEQYGTAMDIYANCPIPGKYVYIKNLNENKEQLLINYQLMDLVTHCAEAVGKENIIDIHARMVNGGD